MFMTVMMSVRNICQIVRQAYMMSKKQKNPSYKYNEGKTLAELKEYIDSTYDEHYSKNKFQATEFIIDGGHGEGFCIGNIMKYAQRYGKKMVRTEGTC